MEKGGRSIHSREKERERGGKELRNANSWKQKRRKAERRRGREEEENKDSMRRKWKRRGEKERNEGDGGCMTAT